VNSKLKEMGLDLEFVLLIGAFLVIFVFVGLIGASSLSRLEKQRAIRMEKGYIENQLKSSTDRWTGDLLLEHFEAIRQAIPEIRGSLHLVRLGLITGNDNIESVGPLPFHSAGVRGEFNLTLGDRKLGTVVYEFASHDATSMRKATLFVIFLCFAFIIVSFFIVSSWVQRRVLSPVKSILAGRGLSENSQSTQNADLIDLENQFIKIQRDREAHVAAIEDSKRQKHLSDLAAQVAHDIRTPLAVLGIVEMNCRSFLDTESRQIFKEALSRIQGIATDLLSEYKLQLDRESDASEKSFLLGASLKRIEREIRARCPEVKEIHFDIARGLECFSITTVRSDFERAIVNLIQNAIESGADGNQNQLLISVVANLNDAGELAIAIVDNGCGIDDSLLMDLRSRRFRSSGKRNGMGLGIKGVMDFVEKSGGRFEIKSQRGVGTSVEIILPNEPVALPCASADKVVHYA
jgi:signal transduction histidine kinase